MSRILNIDDGMIKARLLTTDHPCGICGKKGAVLSLRDLVMPEGLDWRSTILGILPVKRSPYIGLSCGCYAKVHRQIAHIQDGMEYRGPG